MFSTKQKKFLTNCLTGFTLLVCTLCSPAFASFGVVEEGDIDYYGNATVPLFRESIEGTESLDPRDRAYLSSLDQARLINRWYARLLIGNPRVKLSDTHVFIDNVAIASPNDINTKLLQGLLAGGKLWENWAFEAELLFTRKFEKNLNFTPLGIPLATFLKVKEYALFFNTQYILPRFVSYYPARLQIHFDAGFGPAYKVTEVQHSFPSGAPTTNDTRTRVSLAGNLGFGLRYQVTPHILVDAAYRYFQLGSIRNVEVNNIFIEGGTLKNTGLYFGATYQF